LLREQDNIQHQRWEETMHNEFGQLLLEFANDDKIKAVLILIAVDFIFGVLAAIKMGTFRLSYLGDFLRRDVLFKVLPWFVLYSAGKLTTTKPIPGIDFASLATVAFGIIVAAMAASIGSSLVQLGLTKENAQAMAKGNGTGALQRFLGPENPSAGVG
jgi:hypothetical protein